MLETIIFYYKKVLRATADIFRNIKFLSLSNKDKIKIRK